MATPDAVDLILTQWRRERPELQLAPMATIGRLKRCSALLQRRLEQTFADFGLSAWEFDLLATLRRAGAPHCLAPTALFSSLMVTSGTMTRQLQQLQARGLVERCANPDDARSLLVRLTPDGLALIERALGAHLANEATILAPLTPEQRAALDQGLRALLAALEPGVDA